MELYLEKCLELLYDRFIRCHHCACQEDCHTRRELEQVLVVVKQRNNKELAECLGLDS